MKVAYLIGSLNRGGAETLLLDIFRKAANTPFEKILIHRKGGLYERYFEQESSHCYKITHRRFHIIRYLNQLRKKLKQEKTTIIHAFYPLDLIAAKMATIGMNISTLVTFHGYLGGEAGWITGLIYRAIIIMADKICFVSGEQMKKYEQRYGAIVRKKGVVLYNGLNFEKFDAIESGVESQESRVKLCMVGNFNSVRSQIVICKALHEISVKSKAEGIKWDFYFIGGRYSGEEHYYDECVAYCKEHGLDYVHFMGVREDVPALLKSMDGFVYSSRNDTFGIAVIEAIACGLPVVVNDHPVMKEVCGVANAGVRYFRTDVSEDAAAQIEAMMANLEQSQHAALNNAIAVRNKYSIESHIQKVYAIYKTL